MKKIATIFLIMAFSMQGLFSQTTNVSGSAPKGTSNALMFDGIDDYVSIPNGTGIVSGLNAFSMCGWVYPSNANTAWPDFDGYFGIKNEGICDFYIVQLNGTSLEVRITTDQGQFTIPISDLSQVTVNEWQHFTVVYTGSELQLFYNGVLDGSTSASGLISFDNLEITIGKLEFFETDFFLNGRVDEVTFWDKALTADEILEYQCISGEPSVVPNLIAYYNFNETEGLILPDYFGAYDGSLTGMTGSEWIESEVCQSGFDISFVVTDELTGEPVPNAAINLEGIIKNTDENGEVSYTNYDPGIYPFEITKSGYYETSGEVVLVNNDTTLLIELAPVVHYDITYVITEAPTGEPLEGVAVNMSGIIQFTDIAGQTTFTGFLPGSYPYIVLLEGFNIVLDTAEVIDQDLTINIALLIDGINLEQEMIYKIFPNPVSDKVCIEMTSQNSETFISLYNIAGELVSEHKFKDQKSMEINVSEYPSGVYFLRISAEEKTTYQKLMVR